MKIEFLKLRRRNECVFKQMLTGRQRNYEKVLFVSDWDYAETFYHSRGCKVRLALVLLPMTHFSIADNLLAEFRGHWAF